MIQFVCIFFPAIISVVILMQKEKNMSYSKIFTIYTLSVLVITFLNLITLNFLFGNWDDGLSSERFTNIFSMKYITSSLFF